MGNEVIKKIISPSSFLRNKLIEFGINPKKIVHIPNFIFKDEYLPKHEFSNYIVYVGRLSGLKGIKTLTFPILTKIACGVTGQGLSVETLAVISVLGFGLGLVSGFEEWTHRKRKLSKESDYSYLIHLQRNWKKCAMYKNDYNYYLCRQMEEFIND